MKTVKKHLESLPEPYRTQALKQMNPIIADINELYLSRALGGAFSWCNSPQGHIYWSNFSKELEENENRQN